MTRKNFAVDASWRSRGYDEADFAAILGAAFCIGHEFFFLAGYAVALRASFVGPILVAMQQMIDYLFARSGFYAQVVTRLNLMDEYLFDIPLLSICITENIVLDSTCVLATYHMIGWLSR
jgi:hypothetical protein